MVGLGSSEPSSPRGLLWVLRLFFGKGAPSPEKRPVGQVKLLLLEHGKVAFGLQQLLL